LLSRKKKKHLSGSPLEAHNTAAGGEESQAKKRSSLKIRIHKDFSRTKRIVTKVTSEGSQKEFSTLGEKERHWFGIVVELGREGSGCGVDG